MPWNGRITDAMIAAHDRALGSPEYDNEEEIGDDYPDVDDPELTEEELLERQELGAAITEKRFLSWLGLDKEGKPV